VTVFIAADIDVSEPFGNTCRVLAFAEGLTKKGISVTLIVPTPLDDKFMISTEGVKFEFIPLKQKPGSMLNLLKRFRLMIKRAQQLYDEENAALLIEASWFAGFFALAGMKGYYLDVHGIGHDEAKYAKLPWYIPRGLYVRSHKFIEKCGICSASKIIVVSKSMGDIIAKKWNISDEHIVLVPNGYFNSRAQTIAAMNCQEEKGAISFVGLFEKWAAVDKIIRAAKILQDQKAVFYLIGDGPYREELEALTENYGLSNVVFTGKVSLTKAYELIARSEITLLPFPSTLTTEVACPIKVLEYMAFGKAMVVDEVSDICRLLKEHHAAMVSDSDDDKDFADKIRLLLNDSETRRIIGANARALAKNFTWDNQVNELERVIRQRVHTISAGRPE